MKSIVGCVVCLAALLFAGCAVAPQQAVYVSTSGDGQVVVYDLDNASGRLTLKQRVDVGKKVGPIALSADRRFAYAAVRGERAVATLAVDDDGSLTLLDKTGIDTNAAYLSLDRTEQWMLTADYGGGKVGVYRLGDDHRVKPQPIQVVTTDRNAHAIYTDASNRFAFVPHTGPSAIYQFQFDDQAGRLTPNDPPIVIASNRAGPRHYHYHPALNVVYFINELDSTITAYHFDPQRGTLAEFQNVSTLPADFTAKNTCAQLHMTPDGRFLYGSNRGHDSIAAFAVDPATGALSPIGRFATEKRPRGFSLDATGRWLFAAGQDTGRLAVYRIDPQTGALTRTATYDIGPDPTWVQLVTLP